MENAREYIMYLRNKQKFDNHPFIPTQNETLSPQTLRCHTRGLKAFATWLHLNEYTSENSLKNLKLPKAPQIIIEPLTPEEIKKISSSIDQNTPTRVRNYAILVTALDNGLRASEIAGITLGQFNSKEGYIKVMGKGAKERIVPVGDFLFMLEVISLISSGASGSMTVIGALGSFRFFNRFSMVYPSENSHEANAFSALTWHCTVFGESNFGCGGV